MNTLTVYSRKAHGILSERVCKNTSGKGREGNKEGKGTRRAKHASWRLVTYRARPRRDDAAAREVSA